MPAADGRPRIALLAPMPMELSPLVKKLGLRKESLAGVDVHRGSVGAVDVVATKTGIGTELATKATERLLDAEPVDHVVVVGIAGGIDGHVRLGDLLVPEVVVDGATGREYRQVPLGGSKPSGRVRTGDDFQVDAEALAQLGREGFDALDMETASVAAVCEERGVPWSAFRAISDMAGTPGLDEDVLHLSNADGSPNVPAIAKFLVTRPWRIPLLLRLARGSNTAANAAADAAIHACGEHR